MFLGGHSRTRVLISWRENAPRKAATQTPGGAGSVVSVAHGIRHSSGLPRQSRVSATNATSSFESKHAKDAFGPQSAGHSLKAGSDGPRRLYGSGSRRKHLPEVEVDQPSGHSAATVAFVRSETSGTPHAHDQSNRGASMFSQRVSLGMLVWDTHRSCLLSCLMPCSTLASLRCRASEITEHSDVLSPSADMRARTCMHAKQSPQSLATRAWFFVSSRWLELACEPASRRQWSRAHMDITPRRWSLVTEPAHT